MSDDVAAIARGCPHPSVFIREEREARRWSEPYLAQRMGGDDVGTNLLAMQMYDDIGPTTPGLRLGQVTADQLSRAFGVSSAFFLALEDAWLRSHPQSEIQGEGE